MLSLLKQRHAHCFIYRSFLHIFFLLIYLSVLSEMCKWGVRASESSLQCVCCVTCVCCSKHVVAVVNGFMYGETVTHSIISASQEYPARISLYVFCFLIYLLITSHVNAIEEKCSVWML